MHGAEIGPGTAKGGDNFVRDQKHVIFVQDGLNGGPVAFWRGDDAARAHDRLADEGGNSFRTFAQDHFFKVVCATFGKFGLGFTGLGIPVMVRAGGVQDRRTRQIKRVVEGGKARQAAGHDPGAVIAAPARDDLFLLRQAADVVVVPDQLDVGFVGIRSGHAVIDALHAFGGTFDDALRQTNDWLVPVPDIGVVIGQFLGLRIDRIGNFSPAITNIHTVKTGEGIEAFAAFGVMDVNALAAVDDAVGGFPIGMLAHVGRRVHEVRPVHFLQVCRGVFDDIHCCSPM